MIKKIRVADLEIGMFISDMNASYTDHPFMTNTRRVKSAKDVEMLLKHSIQEVYIDTDKGVDSPKAVLAEEADDEVRKELDREVLDKVQSEAEIRKDIETAAELSGYQEELERAKEIYGEAKGMVSDLLKEARLGRSVDGEKAQKTVNGMVDSIFRNQDALISLSRLKSYDDYTFQHSLNVSVLSLALGRSLGLVKDELRRLGVGAILHDLGKMLVPEEILNKPGRLTDEEFNVMKTHTLQGARVLMDAPGVEPECSAVALNHHERFSGKGYPRGLQGMSIGKFGLISAIVDVYDAITSDRVYHKGMPSHQAIQKVYEWGRTDFYPVYVQKFIQCLGVYPVGTAVLLDTGEIGIVYSQNHNELMQPWVRLITDAKGVRIHPYVDVNLTDPDPKGAKKFQRSVKVVIPEEKLKVNIESILAAT